jgi:ATP-dependent helicase YprA (DUF1998 family)
MKPTPAADAFHTYGGVQGAGVVMLLRRLTSATKREGRR